MGLFWDLWERAGYGLLGILTWIHSVTGSWGIAIIVLTLIVRLIMHPLTQKQMTSMKKMQELQPRMKVLQEKYADDKEMLNKKIMELFKENKVNPAAGCLPLLIQLPIFILLFHVLSGFDFEATFLTISLDSTILNMVAHAINLVDPVYLQPLPEEEIGIVVVLFSAMTNLPLLFANFQMWLPNTVLLAAVSFLMYYQQRMMSSGNPQMAMMVWMMPIMMTFISLSIPGGVLLYWGVQSLLGVISQVFIMRKTTIELQKKPVLLQEKPTSKEAE